MEGNRFDPLRDPMYAVEPIPCSMPNCPAVGEVRITVAGVPSDFGPFCTVHGHEFSERLNTKWKDHS